MSKWLGNFFTVRDLLDQGVPGEVIRFVFLSTHYRKPMDWTEKKRAEAEKVLRKWYGQIAGAVTAKVPPAVVDLLADDLNTHGMLAECHRMSAEKDAEGLRGAMSLVGLLGDQVPDWANEKAFDLTEVENQLSAARETAMETKDFAEVDRFKAALVAAGVEVQMSKDGVKLTAPPGFDRSQLEGVL